MINLQLNHEQIINFSKNSARCTCPGYYRWRAALALGRLGSEEAIEPLVKALTTAKESSVRWRAALALGRLGSEKAIEPLVKALTTAEESYVRGAAAHMLGRMGSDRAIETLKQALEDEGEYAGELVKDAAFAALEKISRRNSIRITRS